MDKEFNQSMKELYTSISENISQVPDREFIKAEEVSAPKIKKTPKKKTVTAPVAMTV